MSGLVGLVKAEFRKLLSTQVWIWLLIGTIAFAALVVVLTLAFAGNPDPDAPPGLDDPTLQPVVLSSGSTAIVFVVVLSIIGITQEFRHRTATPTFLTTPRRLDVVIAKLITYLLTGLVYAAVSTAVVLAIAVPWISSSGVSVPLTGENGEVLLGTLLAVALYALVGVGLGALVRNQVGAIVGVLVYLFVLEPIVRAIPATAPFYRWMPGGAQEALTATFQGPDNLLERWQGALLLIGYGLLAAALAGALTLRRDVH